MKPQLHKKQNPREQLFSGVSSFLSSADIRHDPSCLFPLTGPSIEIPAISDFSGLKKSPPVCSPPVSRRH